VDRSKIGKQFILPGLGDSGNASFFYEDEKVTARIALNKRGETIVGFGNYDQPLYVMERDQIDASFAYRLNEHATVFVEGQNLNDENTRLYARNSEMLFLAQDHGPIYRVGFRYKY
jgi:outer membrane receptor protein involved in Fe transport